LDVAGEGGLRTVCEMHSFATSVTSDCRFKVQ
jgi:hypothetical protein